MRIELETCLNDLDWLIRCHNCAAYNCPKEEYSPRSLPNPLDYIDNLQSRLAKVKKGTSPLTLKMILKTYYHIPAHPAPVHPPQQEFHSCLQEEQLETSLKVQPEDMMRKHRDGEYNPLERPQASEEEDEVVTDGPLNVGQGGDLFFQAEVGKGPETPQVTARHFALPIDR